MNRNDLKRLVDNPAHIPGIYNYCDRWCERCAFTERCANFAIGESLELDDASRDLQNEKFWDTLRESFQLTFDLLQEAAETAGIDLEDVEPEEDIASEEQSDRQARQSPIGISTMAYVRLVDTWFDDARHRFAEKGKALSRIASADLPGADVEGDVSDLSDCVDVIRWYQAQIHIKMLRAMRSLEDEANEEDEGDDPYPRDSDGSAKVALVGVDRSIQAWARMWKMHFPEEEDVFLPVLGHLERIRGQIEEAFPDARAFVRPGFDN